MKLNFLWLICMVESMWWGLVYILVDLGGYVKLQIRRFDLSISALLAKEVALYFCNSANFRKIGRRYSASL